ncbi:MAG: O-antigen ligase family protein [Thermoanaerobaculia bacterium]|nr:O-antigen ligase family protein [Thermoanaerobaculia bacterium]
MNPPRQILELPLAIRLTALFYLAHILCAPWIATSEGFLILAAISWIVALRRRELAPVWSMVYLPMGLYVLGSLLSGIFAPDPVSGVFEVSEIVLFLVLPIALSLYDHSGRLRDLAFKAIVFIGSFAASWALFQYVFLGWRDLDHRIRGPASHVMTFSGIIMVISLMVLARIVWKRERALVVPFALLVPALVLTYTRGAWIGWIAGAFWIALSRKPRFALAAVPVLILLILLAPLPLFGRLVSVFDPTISSNLDRIRMAQAGIEMIRDRPLFGNGPGNMEEVYPFYRTEDAPRFRTPHLHSNPVQIWAERGVIAFIAYHLLLLVICVEAWRNRSADKASSDAMIATAIAVFMAGLTEYNFGDGEVLMSWLDVLGISLGGLLLRPLPGTVGEAGAN